MTVPAAEDPARARRRGRVLLIVALLLTGLSMRTAVTSIGPVLDALQSELGMSGSVAGVVTALPVLCFATIGGATPRLARLVGAHRLIALGLAIMTVGLLARAVAGTSWAFALLSVPALTGAAIANVLLPGLVKQHFPDAIGRMTALYTGALATSETLAAGLTVPIGLLGGGWRTGIGSWALLSVVAILPWLQVMRRERGSAPAPAGASARPLLRSRTAWAVVIVFAFQNFQAYIAFGWFAKLLSSYGVEAVTAGAMFAVLTGTFIPAAIAAPLVPQRWHRAEFIVLGSCGLVAYLGLSLAPVAGAWAWMALAGIHLAVFPLALTVIALRSRTTHTTTALSGFVQAIGWAVAGTGPVLFGVVYQFSGGWQLPLALLFVALGVTQLAGWRAAAPRYVDDEI